MIFEVNYNQDDEISNLSHDVYARVNELNELKDKGYTQIKDKWIEIYTGQSLISIDDYITETESYL